MLDNDQPMWMNSISVSRLCTRIITNNLQINKALQYHLKYEQIDSDMNIHKKVLLILQCPMLSLEKRWQSYRLILVWHASIQVPYLSDYKTGFFCPSRMTSNN